MNAVAVAIPEVVMPINAMTGLPFDELVRTADFTGMQVGDPVAYEDGDYTWLGQVFIVEAGAVKHIWNEVDGQMELIFEGI